MKKQVVKLLKPLLDLDEQQIFSVLETPPSREQGDLAFPCFQLAKHFKKSPALIAGELAGKLSAENLAAAGFSKVEAAGPYLNFFFDRQQLAEQVLASSVRDQLADYQIGANKTVVVEYSSPNIAKHFKLYHIRSTMIGQALANTYAALGYQVERMNHLGDWGTQFGKLLAAYFKWGDDEKIKADPLTELVHLYVKFHEEAEKNPELEEEGRLWFKRLEDGDEQAVRLWQWFKEESLKEFEKIYRLLGVTFDHYLGESYYGEKMEEVIEELQAKGLLEESEGALVVRLDDYNIPPCIIKKSDGASIYATRDIAAALYRYERFNPEKILYVVDQRQSLHFQQVFAVLERMGYEFAKRCHHIDFGVMKIEGEIGSTRKGKGVLLNEVLEQAIKKAEEIINQKNPTLPNKAEVAKAVGIGAIVFNDLKQHRTREVNFKWDEAFNFEGKTGPYVQYTHARICSLLRRAGDMEIKPVPHPFYEQPLVWEIIYTLYQYPSVLVETVKKDDPSQIAKYLLDLCQLFNRFYAEERIFVDDQDEQRAKLALCRKIALVLRHGLSMLTIEAPEEI
ncbi:Arginyl-tRNA synthetase [Caldalkalibacillus thermarum TA2.A1]|uniref:Arginine--tRNA ligase n=1 Tax=Caldalkalibacillus thermarum (strain TA2.A1) TaxID=986075 RepID=F5L910_CALTT|nr:arginine--tRNA ligase [Caldalkalibacillus thermarum]EGL82184.1 Arginyl-tRNA synthetase [Caldalkalibacillus thermarum TA2.A1]QZT33103.1 arginine--tRNA ligase [Caldalkalibacillus thermarum TA2.A1]